MKKNISNNLPLGMLLGLVSPFIVLFGINVYSFPEMSFGLFLKTAWEVKTLDQWLVMSLLFNLAVFFLFVNINRLYSARGVVISTFLFVPVIIYLYFS